MPIAAYLTKKSPAPGWGGGAKRSRKAGVIGRYSDRGRDIGDIWRGQLFPNSRGVSFIHFNCP